MMRLPVNGVYLNVEPRGEGPPLVLLHGFTGSIASWEGCTETLCLHYSLIAVDLLGHGRSDSPSYPDRYSMDRAVDDVTAVLDHLGIERFGLLGYSMGGRLALRLALSAPERVEALVIESTSPGITSAHERRSRRKRDECLAVLLEQEGIVAFTDRWEREPVFASPLELAPEARARQREIRLRCDPRGLAGSLRGAGAGSEMPVRDRLSEINAPTLIVVGEDDSKYVKIGRMMAAEIPRGTLEVVAGAGHTVHLAQPAAFQHVVLRSLREHVPASL